MSSGSPNYRPGTGRRGSRSAVVLLVVLLLVILAVAAVVFLVRKPGTPPVTGAAGTVGGTPAQAAAGATAATTPTPAPSVQPTPTLVTVNPSDPASYLELMNVDPAHLPPDQAKVAGILTHSALAASKAPEGYLPLMAQVNQSVFGPLNAGKTKADFDVVRSSGQALRDEVQKARVYFTDLQTSLSADLAKAGLPADLAGGVAGKFVERAQAKRVALYDAVDKTGTDAIVCADTLQKNANAWRREADGKLSFRAKPLMEEFDGQTTRLRADVDAYNGATTQYR